MNAELSTTTLLAALPLEPNWDRQISILRELEQRRDLYNVLPLLAVALQPAQHPDVRRGAIECAALHASEATLRGLMTKAEDSRAPEGERALALQALAALKLPNETLPLFERVAAQWGPIEVRVQAIELCGRLRNIRSVSVLTRLAAGPEGAVAAAARQALDHLVTRNGGRDAVVDRMCERAEFFTTRGKPHDARGVIDAARRLAPFDSRVERLERLLRQRFAA